MQRLFLIGPMGAGKTSLGKLVAAKLNYQFIDSDRVIEARTGVNIATIFDIEGEAGFRQRECAVIDELTQLNRVVLATGGGVVLNKQNRQKLSTRGYVIYLKVSVTEQLRRTSRDQSRPLLRTKNPAQLLTEMAKIRSPLYEETADFCTETHRGRIRQLKNNIIRAYNERTTFCG